VQLIALTQRLSDDLYRVFDGHDTPSAERPFLVTGAHDTVHEHHRALALLAAQRLFGSGFVLLRPIFEACLNGLWLWHIASPDEIARFAKNELTVPKPPRVLRKLREARHDQHASLQTSYNNGHSSLDDYVHSGHRQIVSRLGEGFVGSNYSDAEVSSLLTHANWIALISAVELAEVAASEQLIAEVVSIGNRYVAALGLAQG
jgi:hypothetical protein